MATEASSPHGFDVVRHGFDRAQVQRHVSTLESNLRMLTSDRDNALSQIADLNAEIHELRAEVTRLRERAGDKTEQPPAGAAVYEELRVLIDVTKAEAAQITAQAQAAADQQFASAREAATTLRQRYERLVTDLEAQEAQMRAEHETAMRRAAAELERFAAEAERRRAHHGEQAEQRHRQVEAEFEAGMAARRQALDKEIADCRSASEARAAKLVADAEAEAQRRAAEAGKRIEELSAMRSRLTGCLRETGKLLSQSSSLLEPMESEAEVMASAPIQWPTANPAS